jgi:hypothetical protein
MWNDRYRNPCSVHTHGCFDPITAVTIATVAGGALSAAGTIAGGQAAADAGKAQKGARDFEALQQEQAAQESRAVAQRSAMEQRREGRLLQSRLQARAAASGGGADDPTVVGLGRDIAGRSEEGALFEMYKGENRARGLQDQALGSRMSGDAALAEGRAKRTASYLSAAGTIIGSAGSAYGTYNKVPGYRL